MRPQDEKVKQAKMFNWPDLETQQDASTPEQPKTPSFLRNVINTNFLFNLVMSLGIGTALSLLPAVSATPAMANMNLWTVVKGFSLGCFFSLLAFGFSLLWRVRQPLGEIIAKSNVFNRYGHLRNVIPINYILLGVLRVRQKKWRWEVEDLKKKSALHGVNAGF